jgi:hypothetical protein
MNESHRAPPTPSWYGDSVGHYEGDTLVIDTVGTKTDRPFAMLDLYGTPFTDKLHVVERYRLLSYEEAEEGLERDAKENFRPPVDIDRNYRASICRSISRLRMRAHSRCPGRRPLPMGAVPANGRKSSAQKTRMNIITIRTQTYRPRTNRISKSATAGWIAAESVPDPPSPAGWAEARFCAAVPTGL